MLREEIIRKIEEEKIIAIIRGIGDTELCLRLSEALIKGGIKLIEVTFDQSAPDRFSDTSNAISAIDRAFGNDVCIGAGTVLTPQLAEMAGGAGAKYIISPDVSDAVIEKTRELGLVSIPGAMTPSEITHAIRVGADIIKLFPAGVLGAAYVKSIKAPLNHIKLLATGGVDASNVSELQKAGCIGFGIGGNLVNKDYIKEGRFDKITEAAREILSAIK